MYLVLLLGLSCVVLIKWAMVECCALVHKFENDMTCSFLNSL